MHFTELIRIKRDGGELTPEQLNYAIGAYTADEIPDYQMSAFVMAVLFRGMTSSELAVWTEAMLHSGEVLDWSYLGKFCVDKHSTGGVGDKISIPLAPAVASCGLAVPMISGRGLGHTGGTLDKLEAIPGFQVRIDAALARKCMERIGVAMMGQTEEIAPADRRLYALRDATATVESIPLISSSIMSKKLAEGIGGLVLDVKVGSGAFMKTLSDATALAKTLVGIGVHAGCETVALLTRMDRPLGQTIGNGLEIEESVDVLSGKGPDDVRELVCQLGGEMLVLGGQEMSVEQGYQRIAASLDDGSALDVFRSMVTLQGGDPGVADKPRDVLPRAAKVIPLLSERTGWITGVETREVGMGSLLLGAGRAKKSDSIDPAVGVRMLKTIGDRVDAGEPLAELHVNDESRLKAAQERIRGAFEMGESSGVDTPLLLGRITGNELEGERT